MELDLESEDHLIELRQKLAEEIRAARRRGAVPVYLSLLWFLFSLAISIQSAFGLLGLNSEAHDLALGCLLSWLPVLILCSVVDRNPVNPEKIQKKLNRLVDRVRTSLMDTDVRELYLVTIHNQDQQLDMRQRVGAIADECYSFGDFFVDFAGQGRTRWHYGCAHPILKDIERAYIADKGRDWLSNEREARTLLVLGDVRGGLDWLDYRELWQVGAAVAIVGGTIFGAFCLSFFTPTVGLGCRSGGYLIFAIISFALLLAEMVTWWIMDARKDRLAHWLEQWRQRRRNAAGTVRDAAAMLTAARRRRRREKCLKVLTFIPRTIANVVAVLLPKAIASRLKHIWQGWNQYRRSEKLQNTILRPIEMLNTCWLIYIIVAQTFGAYQTCICQTSHWGGQDYIDFTQYSTTNNDYVRVYWIGGTVVSVSTMGIALAYVMMQWCLQSHLSTLDRVKAARGLRAVRKFRVMTVPILWTYRLLPRACEWTMARLAVLLKPCGVQVGQISGKTTLRWTKENGSQRKRPYRPRSSSRGRRSAAAGRRTGPGVPGPNHSPSGSENAPLVTINIPDYVYLQTPASGARSLGSSDDRSVSPTTRGHRAPASGYLTPERGV